ncbi:MAG: putative membrane protein YvbJ [Flavobacteriales bacterium]|jgi:uncharacterized membrane protein YvbJ
MRVNSIQRKCSSCKTWNIEGELKCKECGATLDVQQKLKEEYAERDRKRIQLPQTQFDLFVDRISKSRNPFIKVAYLTVKTVWFIYWVILSIVLWLIAATPG